MFFFCNNSSVIIRLFIFDVLSGIKIIADGTIVHLELGHFAVNISNFDFVFFIFSLPSYGAVSATFL